MSLEVLEPRAADATVEGSLLFLQPSATKPRFTYSYEDNTADATAVYAPRRVRLHSARGLAASLDVQGFALARRAPGVRFSLENEAQGAGREEAADLVRRATGAARVFVFDHTLRRRAADAVRQPSTRAHVDYTAASAPQRVCDLLGVEAEVRLRLRVAFVNVWRALRHPAEDWPLALCDARSVEAKDLVATDLIYPDRRGENYGLLHNPGQTWFYYPSLELDEALLIKCYDSRTDVARFTPHTAFENPLTRPGAPPRESIEFRTIAFFD